ncbi:hypothetical protein PoB_004538300 [Plakobranchus ocellatus]|uniref:BESS domain-containing protein n=1 Tax=Plakobranchus ocellatus TaxID=259542 RepID=A0AAV4BGZ7_9GAST|nr:hypothetical protein PoB_004538300 [Plakobranchus ocellatus]
MEFLKRHVSHSRAMSSSIRAVDRPTASPTASTSLESETQAEDYPPQQESIQPEESRSEVESEGPRSKKASKTHDEVDKAVLTYMQTLNNQALRNEPEEPLVMWFKSLLPMIKSLTPEQVLSFQITTMQEIQKLTARPQSNYGFNYQSQYGPSTSTNYDGQIPPYQ